MSGLSKEFLNELGVDMDDHTYQLFSNHFDHELHEHILNRILQQCSPEQITELTHMNGVNPDVTWQWLQANIPNLSDIVKAEVDTMLAEVVRNSDYL